MSTTRKTESPRPWSCRKILAALIVVGFGLIVYRVSNPSLGCLTKLVAAEDAVVLQTNWYLSKGHSRKWLLRIEDPLAMDLLESRARQQGVNLEGNSLPMNAWEIGRAREYCPERWVDSFTDQSESISMFFLGGERVRHTYVDIVISANRRLVYLHVWGQ